MSDIYTEQDLTKQDPKPNYGIVEVRGEKFLVLYDSEFEEISRTPYKGRPSDIGGGF